MKTKIIFGAIALVLSSCGMHNGFSRVENNCIEQVLARHQEDSTKFRITEVETYRNGSGKNALKLAMGEYQSITKKVIEVDFLKDFNDDDSKGSCTCLMGSGNKFLSMLTSVGNKQKHGVYTLATSIIKSYFNENCNVLKNSLAEEVFVMEDNKMMPITDKIKEKMCSSVSKAVRDKSKTYNDYVKYYDFDVYTLEELKTKFKKSIPSNFKAQETDYIFLGTELKNDKVGQIEDFIWDDMFVFLVRKENGMWVVKGILN